jgi:hypothetical protein
LPCHEGHQSAVEVPLVAAAELGEGNADGGHSMDVLVRGDRTKDPTEVRLESADEFFGHHEVLGGDNSLAMGRSG